jgi:glucoamylase
MAEVPEQAALGNRQMLATIGKSGELRYLFWPTIDYPQHVLGSLPGIFYSRSQLGKFNWLTDSPWERKQEYVKNANILSTTFENTEAALVVTATDLVLPNSDIVIRHFAVENLGENIASPRFFYYNDLAISETDIDDAAYYSQLNDAIVHYKRDFYLAYGGSLKSSGHQCGVHGESSDAFKDASDHKLSSGSLVLYDGTRAVNSCLSWDLGPMHARETKTLTVFIAMGHSEAKALALLEKGRQSKVKELVSRTRTFWEGWVREFRGDFRSEVLDELTRRSLLVLKLLADQNHGGIVAAPCMNPEYRFCWPRDATYVAYAFDKCGFFRESAQFYEWCGKAQEKEGGLYQRYYIEAKIRGPCWSSQIDEVATVIWGMGKHFDLSGDHQFLQSAWPTIEKAAHFLCENIDPDSDLVRSVGLWEEKFGSHTYSNAAVYGGLKAAASAAEILKESELHKRWNNAAEKVKRALLKSTWNPQLGHFIKTFDPKDETLDISLLGLTVPFEVLPASDERMEKTAFAIEKAFNYKVGGIGRYPHDAYYGGNPWILATLWLALYYRQLRNLDKMKALITWTANHATVLNLLSEQVDKLNGNPISAIPLAWSHAFFILAVLGLDELEAEQE